ncbi:MAG: hypothetical protein EOO99_00840 [Pedobacter sp.]|nr:MAG: hypothetical protein EOO99_00840 [Pedobacter sp.]
MKISIKQTLLITILSLGLTYSASAFESNQTKAVTVLNEIKNIQKLEVSGNVEVFLVQAADEQVKVYDNYYSKNALVQNKDGVLRISSFEKETLKVAVYVKNLNAIQLNDNAKLSTFGKVSFLDLNIQLNGSSKADIFANTIQLTSTVKDSAKLNLSGQSTEFKASLGTVAQLNMSKFNADSLAINSLNKPTYAKVQSTSKSLSDIRLMVTEDSSK